MLTDTTILGQKGPGSNGNQGLGLVGFYGMSTIVGYLMPNPLYT